MTNPPSRTPLRLLFLGIVLVLSTVAAACGSDTAESSSGPITLYSGRNEELMQPLIDAFTEATDIEVEVRYADSAELALLIQTEGDNSPADVFISQSPGALGLLAGQGQLQELNSDLLDRVDAGFRASDDTWVGLTGRVRTLVYNKDLVATTDLPSSVRELTDSSYAGRVGVAPTNGSFQDFVTAMRNEIGDAETAAWLEGMAANGSPNYPKNSAIVEAVGRGEVEMGLVNHYYNLRAVEADPSVPSVNHFFPADDLGALVIVTGGAVLTSSDSPAASEQLLDYLLSDEAQETFVAETQEYALASGVANSGPDGAPALDAFEVDTIDFDLLGEGLTGTQELIRSSGIEQ
ncbi:MAG: extracellular solute-binding protein [Acidimicrobiales bacterium]|nr:extracellular solute-binding protein [Acidimicrobiales bacterium]